MCSVLPWNMFITADTVSTTHIHTSNWTSKENNKNIHTHMRGHNFKSGHRHIEKLQLKNITGVHCHARCIE